MSFCSAEYNFKEFGWGFRAFKEFGLLAGARSFTVINLCRFC